MDDQESDRLSSGWRISDSWPVAITLLLADLAPDDQKPGARGENDWELLSLMVDEAARGVNIAQRFPIFWARIVANSELHRAFQETLALLKDSRAGRLRLLPPEEHQPMSNDE
jgi:hypothetical protein